MWLLVNCAQDGVTEEESGVCYFIQIGDSSWCPCALGHHWTWPSPKSQQEAAVSGTCREEQASRNPNEGSWPFSLVLNLRKSSFPRTLYIPIHESTSPNKAGRGCLIITGQIIHNTSNICFTSKNPRNWNQQLHARTHSLVGDQPCQAHPQQLIFLLIHFWDGNMKSGFKKENDWVEIWPVFARTESLFCFLPCRVRLSAETGSLLYPHGHRPAQRRRKLRVWPWPCSGMGHQGEGRGDPPRPGAAISGPWGKIPKQCGAEGRWGPAWIRTGLALSYHEDERNKKEQWIQPMRAFIKNPNQPILSTCADPEKACLPGPHLALSLAHVPALLFFLFFF